MCDSLVTTHPHQLSIFVVITNLIYNWYNYTPPKQWVVSVNEHNNSHFEFGVIIYLTVLYAEVVGCFRHNGRQTEKAAVSQHQTHQIVSFSQHSVINLAPLTMISVKWQELVIEQGFNSPARKMNWVLLFYQIKYWGLIYQHARFKFSIVLKAAAFPVL